VALYERLLEDGTVQATQGFVSEQHKSFGRGGHV